MRTLIQEKVFTEIFLPEEVFAEVGLLIEQSDKKYKLAKDHKEKKGDYIDKAIENMKKA